MVNTKLLLICLFTFLAAAPTATAQQPDPNATQNQIATAYNAIRLATEAGADTTQLIAQLNEAINQTEEAQLQLISNPTQATTLAAEAQTIAQNVTEQASIAAEAAKNNLPIIPITTAAASIAAGITIYILAPKALWKTWLKLRKNHKIKPTQTKHKEAVFLTAEQLCALILATTVLIAFVSISGYLPLSRESEQFSELGILGPDMKLGDYPSQVVTSESIQLYGYVGNQMGTPMLYTVKTLLGNNQTTINPADNATAIQEYSQVLPDNGTWTFPISITLTQTGENLRIIFELYSYNQTTHLTQYEERWGQIWLNVTAPVT